MADVVVMVLFVLAVVALGDVGYVSSATSGPHSFDVVSSEVVVILSALPAVIAAQRWSPWRVGSVVIALCITLLIVVGQAEDKRTILLIVVPALLVYYLAILSSLRRSEAQDAEKRTDALGAVAELAGRRGTLLKIVEGMESQLESVLGNVRIQVWVPDPTRSEIRCVASVDSGPLEGRSRLGLPVVVQQTGMVTGRSVLLSEKYGSAEGLPHRTVLPLSDHDALGATIRDRRSVQLTEIAKVSDASFPLREEVIHKGGSGVFIKPLVADSNAVGLLVVMFGNDRPHGFSPRETEFISAAADLVALAGRREVDVFE
jgi:hypothetical protein